MLNCCSQLFAGELKTTGLVNFHLAHYCLDDVCNLIYLSMFFSTLGYMWTDQMLTVGRLAMPPEFVPLRNARGLSNFLPLVEWMPF